jgi:hypothetical protein
MHIPTVSDLQSASQTAFLAISSQIICGKFYRIRPVLALKPAEKRLSMLGLPSPYLLA